jgi:photosystem II stability/assembly factor-like uncharacterized protein
VRLALAVVLPLVLIAIAVAACGGPYRFGAATFADDQHGWVAGWDGDMKKTVLTATTDGGATWMRVGARSTQSNARVAGWAQFASPTVGVWAVGLNKLLYTTTGGRPWKAAAVRNLRGAKFRAQSYFSAASFASARVGYATLVKSQAQPAQATGGWVARTRNGGATWRIRKALGGKANYGGFVDVAAPTSRVCFALKIGARGGVWATADRGATWKRHVLPGDTKDYEAIAFTDAQTGWAVGAAGMIANTTDGGVTWTAQTSGVDVRLHGVCFVDASVGYAVGEYGTIIVTEDGGATWTAQVSGWVPDPTVEDDNLVLNDVDFVSATEGWIVSADGWAPGQANGLLHTTDGGVTWTFAP